MTPQEKAQAIVDSNITDFELNGYSIKFLTQPHMSNEWVECDIEVYKNNNKIYINNPVQFANPPVNVQGDSYQIIQNEDGEDEFIYDQKFDPQSAFKLILINLVKHFDK